jgi:hypothetical protein
MLITSSLFVNANTNERFTQTTNIESPVGIPGDGPVYIYIFYGDLDIWWTPSGFLVVDCDPPFQEKCYTIFWSLNNPTDKTVILNDANQTEINVTSEAIITTLEDGTKRHTFTK